MKKADWHRIVLLLCLLLGVVLRFYGLYRGESALLPGAAEAFYHFHTDEETILDVTLQYSDPFTPPLIPYGTPPIYLLGGALALAEFCTGYGDWDLERSPRQLYAVARTLAAIVSCLTLWLVWLLGCRCGGKWCGCLAVFCVAAAPMALQQAHFYTVDGLFALLNTAAMWAMLRALADGERRWPFVLAGILIGASAAARIVGFAGGIVLAVGFALTCREKMAWLRRPHLWLAGASTLLTVLVLEPYQLTAVLGGEVGGSLHTEAVAIARGEQVMPWTLDDVHTLPYLHYWTHLWPAGVGWPLTLAFALGAAGACISWKRPVGLLLLWCILYFAVIGGLHTKPMRYLMPMLPLMSLLAADACVRLWRVQRTAAILLLVAVVPYTAAYGLAYTRVYGEEDSRLQAGRWLAKHAPSGSRVGVEGGGFSLEKTINATGFAVEKLEIASHFRARGYFMCQPAIRHLRERVAPMDYFGLIDVNRYRQFTSVPEWYPVVADFYWKLAAGDLGFAEVVRFKTYPSLGGIEFRDDRADLGYIGFDHPAVLIFRRLGAEEMTRAWQDWGRELWEDPRCPDQALHRSVEAFRAGRMDEALDRVHQVLHRHPRMRVASLLEAAIHQQTGDSQSAHVAIGQYRQAYAAGSAGSGPWAMALNIAELGLQDLVVWSLSFAPK